MVGSTHMGEDAVDEGWWHAPEERRVESMLGEE